MGAGESQARPPRASEHFLVICPISGLEGGAGSRSVQCPLTQVPRICKTQWGSLGPSESHHISLATLWVEQKVSMAWASIRNRESRCPRTDTVRICISPRFPGGLQYILQFEKFCSVGPKHYRPVDSLHIRIMERGWKNFFKCPYLPFPQNAAQVSLGSAWALVV